MCQPAYFLFITQRRRDAEGETSNHEGHKEHEGKSIGKFVFLRVIRGLLKMKIIDLDPNDRIVSLEIADTDDIEFKYLIVKNRKILILYSGT